MNSSTRTETDRVGSFCDDGDLRKRNHVSASVDVIRWGTSGNLSESPK